MIIRFDETKKNRYGKLHQVKYNDVNTMKLP